MSNDDIPPVLADKSYDAPSGFTLESLLREARRQRSVSVEPVPQVCIRHRADIPAFEVLCPISGE